MQVFCLNTYHYLQPGYLTSETWLSLQRPYSSKIHPALFKWMGGMPLTNDLCPCQGCLDERTEVPPLSAGYILGNTCIVKSYNTRFICSIKVLTWTNNLNRLRYSSFKMMFYSYKRGNIWRLFSYTCTHFMSQSCLSSWGKNNLTVHVNPLLMWQNVCCCS